MDGVLLLVGVAFIFLGVFAVVRHTRKRRRLLDEGGETAATIVEIAGAFNEHRAYVAYVVNGVEYTALLGYFSNRMRTGDRVKILVSEKNPHDIAYAGSAPLWMGAVFVLIGLLVTAAYVFL